MKTTNMDTLDIRSIRERPDLFTATTCYLCGAVAARWVGAVWDDIACNACNEATEAMYAAQGGQ